LRPSANDRCLSSRNPFESDNEVLVTILEEMKR
jgi:hypothetical protein